jgi:NAD dependent epimerase/dehydratase family enzyme
MSWVTLDDEVGAIIHAIGNDALAGPVNVVAPSPVVNAEFVATLGRVLHRPTLLPTPLLPLKLRYGDELVESLLLVSQRVTPAQLEASGYTFRHPTLEAGLHAVIAR